ncbi:MAG: hypothetical protein KVP17_003649 [Porospora cf. gigantea B]|uniref:uncharacterized protein n=1 Tax=Porospora cf. gigantea B TaxID=2853592 RepID=UPI0035719BBE|nr:MAG: hypothetical protein KVP17_003649 [Porospora cf. gigantea B]
MSSIPQSQPIPVEGPAHVYLKLPVNEEALSNFSNLLLLTSSAETAGVEAENANWQPHQGVKPIGNRGSSTMALSRIDGRSSVHWPLPDTIRQHVRRIAQAFPKNSVVSRSAMQHSAALTGSTAIAARGDYQLWRERAGHGCAATGGPERRDQGGRQNSSGVSRGGPVSACALTLFQQSLAHLEALEREADICTSVKHCNLSRTQGVFILDPSWVVFVMDFLPGSTRRLYVEFGALPEDEVLSMGKSVLSALLYLHVQASPTHAVVHLDVKSANVLVAFDGRACLVDFGCSRRCLKGSSVHVETVGTPRWMAPEVALSNMTRSSENLPPVTEKADVWSLGMFLLELATGEMPFGELSDEQAMYLLADDQADVWPHLTSPPVSQALSSLIAKMLARNPNDRPSVEEVMEAPLFARCK